MIRALTILNEAGDTTIAWTEDRDAEVEAIIAKRMAEGVTFFIVEPRVFGILPPKKTQLVDVADVRKHRILSIPDEDFAKFVGDGHGDAIRTPDEPVKTVRKAKTAKEVASSQSVGVRPMKGG